MALVLGLSIEGRSAAAEQSATPPPPAGSTTAANSGVVPQSAPQWGVPKEMAPLLPSEMPPAPPAPQGLTQADVVRRVLPSVVNINITKNVAVKASTTSSEAAGSGNQALNEAVEQFFGSGFIIDPSGVILTNRHVIQGALTISVTFSDGSQAGADLCAYSNLVDLAIVKVSGQPKRPAITWGNSEALMPGDPVLAIGNPLGVGESVSSGIVSALHRRISSNPFDDFIQTDAPINHGNSGGPLIDSSGNVVGVNTAFYSETANGGSLGVGFAIPSFEARLVAGKLSDCRQDPPGWIGLTVQQVTPDIAHALSLSDAAGTIVTAVAANSPAQHAGMQEGDVIESLDGAPTPTPLLLLGEIALMGPGKTVQVGYWRNGQTAQANMVVAAWPGISTKTPARQVQAATMHAMDIHDVGIHFVDKPGPKGASEVVVSLVDQGSGAFDAGLHAGDVILRVADKPATSAAAVLSQLQKAEQEGRRTQLLLVKHGDHRRWVAMRLGFT